MRSAPQQTAFLLTGNSCCNADIFKQIFIIVVGPHDRTFPMDHVSPSSSRMVQLKAWPGAFLGIDGTLKIIKLCASAPYDITESLIPLVC